MYVLISRKYISELLVYTLFLESPFNVHETQDSRSGSVSLSGIFVMVFVTYGKSRRDFVYNAYYYTKNFQCPSLETKWCLFVRLEPFLFPKFYEKVTFGLFSRESSQTTTFHLILIYDFGTFLVFWHKSVHTQPYNHSRTNFVSVCVCVCVYIETNILNMMKRRKKITTLCDVLKS